MRRALSDMREKADPPEWTRFRVAKDYRNQYSVRAITDCFSSRDSRLKYSE